MRRRTGAFRALDFVFDIRGPIEIVALFDDIFADLATDAAPAATIDVTPPRRTWSGRDDWRVGCRPDPVRHGDLAAAVAFVIDETSHRAVRSATSGVAIHAAAVATPAGVIALTGPSGSGKSTLAAAAARHGLGYVADEVTMVDRDLGVRPFHRPIGLRADGAAALGLDVPAASDGRFDDVYPYRPPSESLVDGGRLVGICLVEVGDSADTGTVEVRPAEALVELASGTLGNAADDDRDWFRRLTAIVQAVPVARLRFADATTGLGLLSSFASSI